MEGRVAFCAYACQHVCCLVIIPGYMVHSNTIGGSANEITPSAHLIIVDIAPWTEPFLAYLNRKELPEDQNEARCIIRLIKSCMEGLANKGRRCGVVTAESGVNFSQELPPLFLGDTSLKNSGSAFLVELSIMNLVGL